MSEIRDRAEEKITGEIVACASTYTFGTLLEFAKQYASKILAIPEIAVVDRDAELPENPHNSCCATEAWLIYDTAQQDMLKAGYVKEIK